MPTTSSSNERTGRPYAAFGNSTGDRQMLERPAETWLQNEAGSVGVTQSPCNRSTARLDRARKPAGQSGTLVYYALQVLPIAPLGQHGTMAPWLT